jgi:hypothetical protein
MREEPVKPKRRRGPRTWKDHSIVASRQALHHLLIYMPTFAFGWLMMYVLNGFENRTGAMIALASTLPLIVILYSVLPPPRR